MSLKQLLKLLRENPKMRWKKRRPNRTIRSLRQQKRRNENGRVTTFIICRSQRRRRLGKRRNRPIHVRSRPIASPKRTTRMRETQNLGHILLSRISTMCIILSPLRTLPFITALTFLYIYCIFILFVIQTSKFYHFFVILLTIVLENTLFFRFPNNFFLIFFHL